MQTEPLTGATTSVVIPAFNAEAYLGRAIKSVVQQEESPREIIVVDDGSTDHTGQVAASFGDRVRYVLQQHGGSAEARNHGIRIAEGAWIAFLDADDEWLANRIGSHQDISARHPTLRWLSGFYESVANDGSAKLLGVGSGFIQDHVVQDALASMGSADSWAGNVPWTGTISVHRGALTAVVDKQGNFFDPAQRSSHDLDLWIRLAARFPAIGYSDGPIARYYSCLPGSLTATESSSCDESLVYVARRGCQLLGDLSEKRSAYLRRFIDRLSIHCCKNAVMSGHVKYGRWLCREYQEIGVDMPLYLRALNSLPPAVTSSLVRLWRTIRAKSGR